MIVSCGRCGSRLGLIQYTCTNLLCRHFGRRSRPVRFATGRPPAPPLASGQFSLSALMKVALVAAVCAGTLQAWPALALLLVALASGLVLAWYQRSAPLVGAPHRAPR